MREKILVEALMKVPATKSKFCRTDAVSQGTAAGRPKISLPALTYLRPTRPQRPNYEFLCSLQVCSSSSRKTPHLATSSISWTSYTTFSPQTNGFTSLTACRIVQMSQTHPPVGTSCHPTFLLLWILLPTASACSLYLKCCSHVALRSVVFSVLSLHTSQIVSICH